MAYTPTVWETGDVITAEKLNKAEQGIAGASPLVATLTYNDNVGSIDKTGQEIINALSNNIPVYIKDVSDDEIYFYFLTSVQTITVMSTDYYVFTSLYAYLDGDTHAIECLDLYCETLSDYPNTTTVG